MQATGRADYLLKSFVDRMREVSFFEKVLAGDGRPIIAVQGPGGVGKSLLIHRLIQECSGRGAGVVEVEWDDSQRYNYLDVMRQIRDQTNVELFDLFTDRVNYYTKPAYELKIQVEGSGIENVKVLENGEIRDSDVTIHVGHNIEISDSAISALRPDRDIEENEAVIELTSAFLPCLRAATATTAVCIFLDALEKSDHLTLNWITRHLLSAIRDGSVPNLVAVISGRENVDLDPSFFDCSEVFNLRPFEVPDILDYLEARTQTRDEDVATLIFSIAEGDPRKTAATVDNWIRSRRQS